MSSRQHRPIAGRRQLAIQLGSAGDFERPDPRLEQYSLDCEAAADLLWLVKTENPDLSSRRVLDLGCGTGILAVGAAMLGSPLVVGVDVDSKALRRAREFAQESGVDAQIDWIRARVPTIALRVDLVVQNPPFGVRRRGNDRSFLETALRSGELTYSIHLASESSRRYLQTFIEEHDATLSGIIPIAVKIRHTLPEHRKRLHQVRAEIYKIRVTKNEQE